MKTSPEFSSRSGLSGGGISSLTATCRSTAAAREMLTALTSQRAAQCLQSSILGYLAPAAAGGHLRLQPSVQVTPLPVSIAGSPHAFGYRMAVAAQPRSSGRQQFTIYVDLCGAVTGQILTELTTYSNGQLMPATTERRLMTLLVGRARTLPGTGR